MHGEPRRHSIRPAAAKGGNGAGNEIGLPCCQPAREGATDRQGIGGCRHCRKFVRHIGEDHQALKVMVAVLAPARNMQREVDLGRSQFD